MATIEEAAAKITDFAQPLDVTMFEQIVETAYQTGNPQQQEAARVLVTLQEHPGSKRQKSGFQGRRMRSKVWTRVTEK